MPDYDSFHKETAPRLTDRVVGYRTPTKKGERSYSNMVLYQLMRDELLKSSELAAYVEAAGTGGGVTSKSFGEEAIPNGAEQVTVTFPTAFTDAPDFITAAVSKPTGGQNVFATERRDLRTATEAVFDLSGPVPAAGYSLNWEAKLAAEATSVEQFGEADIGDGLDSVTIAFDTSFAGVPTLVTGFVNKPDGTGDNIFATERRDLRTADSITFELSGPAPGPNHKLTWLAKL